MKTKAVAMFVVGVCIMAWGCGVSTQQAEAQFRIVEEIYIAPGTAEEFEAAYGRWKCGVWSARVGHERWCL